MDNVQSIKYLLSAKKDEQWGITINTVGTQTIEKNYISYPPAEKHPEGFFFDVNKGRILDSWQLLYIHSGKGTIYDKKGNAGQINCGEMILLRPGVWHSYTPDKETGWEEYWIGFKGPVIDERVRIGFLSKTVYRVGVREDIVSIYNDAIKIAIQEKPSYQQYLSGIVNLLLGIAVYLDTNHDVESDYIAEKIDSAKHLIRSHFNEDLNLEDIAKDTGMSYSWFRKKFKEFTGISPAKYILSLRIQEACRLLSESKLSIKEISWRLNFDDASYFSAMFTREVGISPKEYRARFNADSRYDHP